MDIIQLVKLGITGGDRPGFKIETRGRSNTGGFVQRVGNFNNSDAIPLTFESIAHETVQWFMLGVSALDGDDPLY